MDFLKCFWTQEIFLIMLFGLEVTLLEEVRMNLWLIFGENLNPPPLALLLYENHQAQQCCGRLAEELPITIK